MDVRNVLVINIEAKSSACFDYLSTGVVFISGTVGALPVAFMAEVLTLRTSGINGQFLFVAEKHQLSHTASVNRIMID